VDEPLRQAIDERVTAHVAPVAQSLAVVQASLSAIDRTPSVAAQPVPLPPPAPVSIGDDGLPVLLTIAARALAASGQHLVIRPTENARTVASLRGSRIGFFGNIANNAHNFARCLRRLGYQTELVIEDGWFDTFVMNRPFWEDVPAEAESYEAALAHEAKWTPPDWIRKVSYDLDLQLRYQKRLSAVDEVQALYKQAFEIDLPPDRALLLAQQMGHWPYLLAMKRYDVVQFSGAPISLAPFCPRPFVVFPTGSDLWVSPFEESVFGLLVRAGYRGAAHVLACEPAYAGHLRRMQRGSFSPAPMMIDTDRYLPGPAAEIRDRWTAASGGRRFLLASCRHTWLWKGNDRLIRGFAEFARNGGGDWRLVLQSWGDDIDRSRALIHELGLEPLVIWEPLSSKSTLRLKQRAADLAADQFVVPGGYGTSVLEAMAAGKAVLIVPPPPDTVTHLSSPPPFVGASDPASISEALGRMSDDAARDAAGRAHLDWLRQVHGYESVAGSYLSAYARALGLDTMAPAQPILAAPEGGVL
jgi:glycosyltransferase involved in cell wall biosynthesis